MASFIRKLFGAKKRKITRKDSITGRNKSWVSEYSFFNKDYFISQPVPYLSKLEGNQLQPGQSLIVRGIVVGLLHFIWIYLSYTINHFLTECRAFRTYRSIIEQKCIQAKNHILIRE